MENWLNINQFRVVEWGLNSNEEKLCAYYAKPHNWITTKIADTQGDYFCIAITKLIQELPTIGKTKPNFSRALNSLADKQVFDKIVNIENKKEVYYRFNPIFLKAWKDNSKKIASDIIEKKLTLFLPNECYEFVTSVTEIKLGITDLKQSVTDLKQSVTEMEPISINNQINNQINNNHNKGDDSTKAITEMKHTDLKKEFEKILDIYPHTVNNTNEKIAEAFGVFMTLNPSERFDVFKAVQNYSKTENVKSQKTSKYIQSLYTFLTKSYTKFIYGLPKNYTFTEEFEQKKSEVGADNRDSCIVTYEQEDIDNLKIYTSKFEKVQEQLKSENKQSVDDKYNYEWVKKIFSENEFEILFVKMGGLNNVIRYSATQLAESMLDIIKAENE